jgi:G:T/U-mismatch repair DNA glycosylase
MRASRIGQNIRELTGLLILIAGLAGALASVMPVQSASAQDVPAALQKANAYIEIAKMTERAVESWERYASWVNMKTGPTGKERYISYGMYDLYDLAGLLKEARVAAGTEPGIPKLDATMKRYIDAYEALAPVMNQASAYYDRNDYKTDNAAEGQALHKQMVPLATTFLAERDAMMPELRVFVRDVEQQEIAAIETREGRSAAWQVGQVMHAANRVIDLFPRNRPAPIDSDTLDEMINALGPDTPGEKFDEIIAGVVPPQNAVIDVTRFGEALEKYAEAVDAFDRFAGEKPEEFGEFKALPRQMLDLLREFQGPLTQSQGREFDGGAQMGGQIAEVYFSMLNAGNSIWGSQLRFLP